MGPEVSVHSEKWQHIKNENSLEKFGNSHLCNIKIFSNNKCVNTVVTNLHSTENVPKCFNQKPKNITRPRDRVSVDKCVSVPS